VSTSLLLTTTPSPSSTNPPPHPSAIARDAALEVIKDAARDAGYDLDFELPSGDDAAKDEEAAATEEAGGFFLSRLEDAEEADMALFDPLDLGLEDVLAALGSPQAFGDRQQVTNQTTTTVTTTTNTTDAAKEGEAAAAADDDDAGFLLSALRQMNLTANEADRLRTRARTAAESALRDAVRACLGFAYDVLSLSLSLCMTTSNLAQFPPTHRSHQSNP
jgi:hypothetical protein